MPRPNGQHPEPPHWANNDKSNFDEAPAWLNRDKLNKRVSDFHESLIYQKSLFKDAAKLSCCLETYDNFFVTGISNINYELLPVPVGIVKKDTEKIEKHFNITFKHNAKECKKDVEISCTGIPISDLLEIAKAIEKWKIANY